MCHHKDVHSRFSMIIISKEKLAQGSDIYIVSPALVVIWLVTSVLLKTGPSVMAEGHAVPCEEQPQEGKPSVILNQNYD